MCKYSDNYLPPPAKYVKNIKYVRFDNITSSNGHIDGVVECLVKKIDYERIAAFFLLRSFLDARANHVALRSVGTIIKKIHIGVGSHVVDKKLGSAS